MADLLIRDVSPEILVALDSKASALGLSRVEYVRRTLAQSLAASTESVTEKHLSELLELLPDLADEKIMEQAWR